MPNRISESSTALNSDDTGNRLKPKKSLPGPVEKLRRQLVNASPEFEGRQQAGGTHSTERLDAKLIDLEEASDLQGK